MEFIKAHVINFGKLHDFDFDFKDGLNSVIHENGWGKTTFSVFIKAMLYGMEYTTSKDLEKNERKKYEPWQGGVYGGSLSFSEGGKTYQITRTFGTKKGSDTFSLIDLKTNKPSTDFSENLGEELFGINSDTYQRSVYVILDEAPMSTDDISAKLNNLVEAADVSNFEDAIKTLDDKSKDLKAKRGEGGEIQQIQRKIDDDRELLEVIVRKIGQNEFYEKENSKLNEQIESLKKSQNSVAKEISVNAKYESKLRYEQLKKDVENAKKNKEELIKFFNGKIPSSDILQKIDEITSDFTTVDSNVKNNTLTQAEKDKYESLKNYFAGDIPSKESIAVCLKTDGDYKKFKQTQSEKKLSDQDETELSVLSKRFSDGDISDEKIQTQLSSITEVQNAKIELANLSQELQAKQNELNLSKQAKNKNPLKILFLILAFLLFASGAALFIFVPQKILGIASIGIGILFFIIGILLKSKKQDFSNLEKQSSDIKDKILLLRADSDKKENECNLFISKFSKDANLSPNVALTNISVDFSQYKKLSEKQSDFETWLNSQEKTQDDYENELKTFVKRFCKTSDISSVPSDIQVLNEKLSELYSLEEKINSETKNKNLLSEKKEKLESILSQYQTEKTLGFSEQVQEIHNKIQDIKNADEQILEDEKKLAQFEENSENDIKSFANLKKPEKSTDQLQDELKEITDEINKKNEILASNNKIIDDNLTDTERKEDVETEIESLSAEKKEKSYEYDILEKTKEFLQKAKDNLDANYSEPMKNNFEKYIKLLGSHLNVVIDTNLNVSLEENGILHESKYLSEGYKDLVNFCARMALVDSLFKDNEPPVILDDPFVNLDDDKIPRALRLVQDMSNEKQILYFACHQSRNVETN